ncbi:coiled-coil domain-containing protein 12 isoform X1 [Haemorhous mexicanus]|uniref:coiled-coil domain-containing protein 12 isoform X1 n=1 Tax=Haemorhous mexicanus TaxID=30427 RepID=UPI0028BE7DBF|nr:coiled-coil domain-containing protein 12 isoform X1 [Haemorhous mexicanus]
MSTWRRERSRESSEPCQGLQGLQESWRGTGDKGWRDRTQGMAPTARGQGWVGDWELGIPGWDGIPRAAVAAPGSLAVSKARLDLPGTVGGVPAHGMGWNGITLQIPPSPFQDDSMISIHFSCCSLEVKASSSWSGMGKLLLKQLQVTFGNNGRSKEPVAPEEVPAPAFQGTAIPGAPATRILAAGRLGRICGIVCSIKALGWNSEAQAKLGGAWFPSGTLRAFRAFPACRCQGPPPKKAGIPPASPARSSGPEGNMDLGYSPPNPGNVPPLAVSIASLWNAALPKSSQFFSGREFLAGRVGRGWDGIPREAADAPGSLEVSKDGAWSTLGSWKLSLPMALIPRVTSILEFHNLPQEHIPVFPAFPGSGSDSWPGDSRAGAGMGRGEKGLDFPPVLW